MHASNCTYLKMAIETRHALCVHAVIKCVRVTGTCGFTSSRISLPAIQQSDVAYKIFVCAAFAVHEHTHTHADTVSLPTAIYVIK